MIRSWNTSQVLTVFLQQVHGFLLGAVSDDEARVETREPVVRCEAHSQGRTRVDQVCQKRASRDAIRCPDHDEACHQKATRQFNGPRTRLKRSCSYAASMPTETGRIRGLGSRTGSVRAVSSASRVRLQHPHPAPIPSEFSTQTMCCEAVWLMVLRSS